MVVNPHRKVFYLVSHQGPSFFNSGLVYYIVLYYLCISFALIYSYRNLHLADCILLYLLLCVLVESWKIFHVHLLSVMWQTRLKDYEATLSNSPKDPIALEVSLWLFCRIPVLFLCYCMLLPLKIEMYLCRFDWIIAIFLLYGYMKHISKPSICVISFGTKLKGVISYFKKEKEGDHTQYELLILLVYAGWNVQIEDIV